MHYFEDTIDLGTRGLKLRIARPDVFVGHWLCADEHGGGAKRRGRQSASEAAVGSLQGWE